VDLVNTSTILRAGQADLIAYAFYVLGYRPRESLVLIGLHGARLRVGMSLRLDLPSPPYDVPLPRHQLDLLRKHGEDALVLLVVSDVPPGPGGAGPPHGDLVGRLRRLLTADGWRVIDVLAVGPARWRSYLCHDPVCCPPQGRSLDEVSGSMLAAWMVSQGEVLVPDEQALVADVEPAAPPGGWLRRRARPATAAPSTVESLARWRALLRPDCRDPDAGPGDVGPGDVGIVDVGLVGAPAQVRWLAEALQDRWFRDAVLLTLMPDAGTAPDEVLAGSEPAALDALLDTRPDRSLLARWSAPLAAVARSAPPGERADALALLAWAAWWAGDGPRGRLLAARALADRPEDTFAALVDQLLFVGVPPGWLVAQRREASAGSAAG